MTPDNQLDTVLRHLDKDKDHFATGRDLIAQFRADTKLNISDKDFDMLLHKLVLDGHVEEKPSNDTNIDRLLPPNFFRITFQGRQFLNHAFIYKNRPYKAKATLAKIANAWTVLKTIVIIIHAVLILIIAAAGVWVAYDSRQKDLKIDGQQQQLDKQAATIDSLLHLPTMTKADTTK